VRRILANALRFDRYSRLSKAAVSGRIHLSMYGIFGRVNRGGYILLSGDDGGGG
jgi:hypothetical protein